MYTKTRNDRKKRLKRTNTVKLLEISEAMETKLPVSLFYSRFLRIHDLRLAFCKVWKVWFIFNIMFIISKSLFDIGSCSTSIFSRVNTLK